MIRKSVKRKRKNPDAPLPYVRKENKYKKPKGYYSLDVIDRSKLSKDFPKISEDLDEWLDENDISWGDGEFNLIPLVYITSNTKLKDLYVNIEG